VSELRHDLSPQLTFSKHASWETVLAPRLILGLWHPLFLKAAYDHLPLLRRYHIGFSPNVVRTYFWDACDGFSINFALLMGKEGQKFLQQCREAGKEICVWTVNDPGEMKVAMSWGVKAILTDRVGAFTSLRDEVCYFPQSTPPSDPFLFARTQLTLRSPPSQRRWSWMGWRDTRLVGQTGDTTPSHTYAPIISPHCSCPLTVL